MSHCVLHLIVKVMDHVTLVCVVAMVTGRETTVIG